MEWFAASNDGQRLAALAHLLRRAVSLFPPHILNQQARADALASIHTMQTAVGPAPATASGQAQAVKRRATGPSCAGQPVSEAVYQRVAAREARLRAFIAVQQLLLRPLRLWWPEANGARAGEAATQIAACAEAVRLLDGCFMQGEMLLYVPYRSAVLVTCEDMPFIPEDEPWDLQQIEVLRDALPWYLWGSQVPVLGNPLGGLCPFPEELIQRTGVARCVDWDLLGLMFVCAAVEHCLAASVANEPECSPFMVGMVQSMLSQFESMALKVLIVPRVLASCEPHLDRAIWSVVGSLHSLARYTNSSITAVGRQTVQFVRQKQPDPAAATYATRMALEGTGLLPPADAPPTPLVLQLPPEVQLAPARPKKKKQNRNKKQRAKKKRAAAAAEAGLGAGHADTDGEQSAGSEEDGGDGATAAGAPQQQLAQGMAGLAVSAQPDAARTGSVPSLPQAALSGHKLGAVPEAAASASANAPASISAPLPDAPRDSSSAEILESAVHAIEACPICFDDLSIVTTRFLDCNLKSHKGPFHVMCVECWDAMKISQCPECRRTVRDIHSFHEVLELLSAKV